MKKTPLLFDGAPSGGMALPTLDVPELDDLLPEDLTQNHPLPLEAVAQGAVVRHYAQLAQSGLGQETACFSDENWALGCDLALLNRLGEPCRGLHPLLDQRDMQGALNLLMGLDKALQEITGMDKFSLQPGSAGQGELAALMIVKAYHEMRQQPGRNQILVAQGGCLGDIARLAGFVPVEVPAGADGGIDPAAYKAVLGEHTAGICLEFPAVTEQTREAVYAIISSTHQAGGLACCSVAALGPVRPGDLGWDVIGLALLATLGAACPGGLEAFPVGVKKELIPYLPKPLIMSHEGGPAMLDYDRPVCIGQRKAFFGNFEALLQAYARILSLGKDGLEALQGRQ